METYALIIVKNMEQARRCDNFKKVILTESDQTISVFDPNLCFFVIFKESWMIDDDGLLDVDFKRLFCARSFQPVKLIYIMCVIKDTYIIIITYCDKSDQGDSRVSKREEQKSSY